MKCQQCGASVVLKNSKFCNECGAKIEPLKSTPPKCESFTSVRVISIGLGSDFKIMPSDTNETTVIVDGPEEIKQGLTMKLKNGILEIQGPSESAIILTNSISDDNVYVTHGVFVGRNVTNIFMGDNISIGGDATVSVSIVTPRGVDVSIDTNGGVNCEVGDLQSNISVDTSGGLSFIADCITGFDADVSGSVSATISHFESGRCNIDVAGGCNLNAPSGHIEKLKVDVSGSATLHVNAKTDKAVLNISGSLQGNLRADVVNKHVSGRDRLNVIS